MKASVDVSDLGALEKQLPEETFATFDDYEKHHKAVEKEVVGSYVSTSYLYLVLHFIDILNH